MATRTETVRILLKKLAEETGIGNFKHGNCGKMSEMIDNDEVSQGYLYTASRKLQKAQREKREDVDLNEKNLEPIAVFLGYDSFFAFETWLSNPSDKELSKYEGQWWSYVRANEGNYIFRAPISIYPDPEKGMYLKLKGEQNVFIGKVEMLAGCLFCELRAGNNKKLYIVMKGSTNEKFSVLQGTFSGISSASRPIGGKEVFIREDKLKFEDMKWEKTEIDKNGYDPRINRYFWDPKESCIKIEKMSAFDISDLER
jgi:hypothetical protein